MVMFKIVVPIIRHTIQSTKYKSCRVWKGKLIVTLTITLRSMIKVISRSNRFFQVGTPTYDLVKSGKYYVLIRPWVKVMVKVMVSVLPVLALTGWLMSDLAFTGRVISDHVLTGPVMSNLALTGRVMSDLALTGRVISDLALDWLETNWNFD